MMSEKKNTLGKAVAVAAGVGAAYLALKKKENEKQRILHAHIPIHR